MLLCLCYFMLSAINAELQEPEASRVVGYFLEEQRTGQWEVAKSRWTREALVTGIPTESPEKRWSKSIDTYLAEKPRWHGKILEWKHEVNDSSATVLVVWRQGHLLVHSRWDLLRLHNEWKIDGLRFSTRRDAPETAEQWKKLTGIWEWKPDAKSTDVSHGFLKRLKLDLRPDDFSISTTAHGFNLFGPTLPDREDYHHDSRVRLLSQGKTWYLQLDWPGYCCTDGLFAEYQVEQDQLTLRIHYLGNREFERERDPIKLVLKRQ
jgi:hypothetical protein